MLFLDLFMPSSVIRMWETFSYLVPRRFVSKYSETILRIFVHSLTLTILLVDKLRFFTLCVHSVLWFTASKRDCIERFGQRTIERINHDNDVICTTEYSRIVPLENGEVMILIKHSHPLYVPIYPVYRVTTGPGAYARRLRAQGGVIFIMTVTSALLIKDLI